MGKKTGCGNETKHYLKYKWYHKTWEIYVCGELGYLCDNCKAYNQGWEEALKQIKEEATA